MPLSVKKIASLTLFATTLWVAAECHAQDFVSETKLSGIPFDQPGEYVFHYRTKHSREITLLLEVKGSKGEPDREELTHLRTFIGVSLVDHRGHMVCQAVGSPKDGISTNNWVLRTAHDEAAYWHWNCREIKLHRSESYTLTVRIRDVDPRTPKIKLTPSLERSDEFGP